MIIISIINLATYIGIVLGYIIGLKIWDCYYERVIVPKKKELERQHRLNFLEVCKVIGNPKEEIIL